MRPLFPASPGTFSARAYVAHTLDYRRRKGTAAMLEQLAHDVTGWPARVVEFFQLLATTQYLNHLRPANITTPDLRDSNRLELLNGPFDAIAHTAEIRHIHNGRGRYNIPSIGIFLWKLENYLVGPGSIDATSPAARATRARHCHYRPTGDSHSIRSASMLRSSTCRRLRRTRRFLPPKSTCPGMLRRRPLYDELEARRQAKVDNRPAPSPVFFGEIRSSRSLPTAPMVLLDQVMVCDISDVSATDWRRPQPTKSYTPPEEGRRSTSPSRCPLTRSAAASPFRRESCRSLVEVAYNYGFSADVGAGPYDRSQWLSDAATAPGPLGNAGALAGGGQSESRADRRYAVSHTRRRCRLGTAPSLRARTASLSFSITARMRRTSPGRIGSSYPREAGS